MRRTMMVLGLCAALAVTGLPAGDDAAKGEKKRCPGTMEECLASMIARFQKSGLIGLDGTWDEETGGLKIEKFLEASMAESAGIKVGDLLVKINDIPLVDEKASKEDGVNRQPGNTVSVTVLREGRPLTVNVTLIPYPADVMARQIGLHMMEYHSPAMASKGDSNED